MCPYLRCSRRYCAGVVPVRSLNEAGVDLVMPGGAGVVKALKKAFKEGRLSTEAVRHAAGRFLDRIL
jgi:hypothetical protein